MTRTRRASGRIPRWLMLVVVAAVSLCAVPREASAHAFLESSTPAANTVLPGAPPTATLRFTEPLESSYSRAELFDGSGGQVSGAAATIGPDPNVMTVTLPSGMGNGTYSLLWRTLSTVDGHTAQGYLPFTIGTEADVRIVAPPVANETIRAAPEWAMAGARWLGLLGLAAMVGIWPIWVFVVRPSLSPVWQLGPKTTRRVRGYATGAFAFALLANVIGLIVQALSIAGPNNLVDGVMTTLGQTRYGTWWLIRVGAILIFSALLLGVGWWRPWQRKAMTIVTLAAAFLLPLPYSMIAHAGAEPVGQATAIAFDFAHGSSAALWVGGLFVLVVALAPLVRDLTPSGQRVVLSYAIPRFSLIALIGWSVLAVTGLYASWLQVGNLAALTSTPYGQTLILKLVLIVPLLLLGVFNLLIVTRKLKQALTEQRVEGWSNHFITALLAEVVIVTLLLGVVGMLIGTPPARQVLEQESGRISIPLEADGQSGTLYITPGMVGQNHYRLELGTGHEAHLRNPAITNASLRLQLPERATGQIDVPLLPAPTGGYEAHGSELALPGDWQLQVTVLMPGQPDWVVTATQPILATPPASNAPPPPPLFGPAGIAGLALLIAGMSGIIAAVVNRGPLVRKEAAGLGVVAVVAAIVLLLQARIPDTTADVQAMERSLATATFDQGSVERGKGLFTQNCVACHGPGGTGDGPRAATLTTPPSDLTSGHSVPHPDSDFLYWIENGIAGTDMPGFGATLDTAQIEDVITYVRSLQQQALLARDAPGGEECQDTPRSQAEIAALAKTPAPTEPTNATETGGVPADRQTTTAITDVAREMVACSNAGDILRRLALYSDNRLRFDYPNGLDSSIKAMASNPLPAAPYERMVLLGVDDVRKLDDGRVSARVRVENPSRHSLTANAPARVAQQETVRLIFVQEDGAWRVDETRREETPRNATPIPASTSSGG